MSVCRDFLSEATAMLLKTLPSSRLLAELSERIGTLATERAPDFEWYLSFDNIKIGAEKLKDKLRKLADVLPDLCDDQILRAPILMFGTLSPELDEEDIDEIIKYVEPGDDFGVGEYDLRNFSNKNDPPYEAGYVLAEEFFDRYNAKSESSPEFVDIYSIVKEFRIKIREVSLRDRNMRGAALAGW
jgi:hypothetical protein